MKNELLKGLSEEQIAKVKECKNQEEIIALAKDEGVELTNEQLEAVAGGGCTPYFAPCPNCGSKDVRIKEYLTSSGGGECYVCNDCNRQWGHRTW